MLKSSAMRALVPLLAALLLAGAGRAEARVDAKARSWVSMVLGKIGKADRTGGRGGTVTIRVRIASDGALDGVEVEESSGSKALDERAIRAVRAAAPFPPPPSPILTLEGYTELSFPLQLGGAAVRGRPRAEMSRGSH